MEEAGVLKSLEFCFLLPQVEKLISITLWDFKGTQMGGTRWDLAGISAGLHGRTLKGGQSARHAGVIL